MVLFNEGDWLFYKYNDTAGLCLRHTGCEEANPQVDTKGVCSCDGECAGCEASVPDTIKGFFALTKWGLSP